MLKNGIGTRLFLHSRRIGKMYSPQRGKVDDWETQVIAALISHSCHNVPCAERLEDVSHCRQTTETNEFYSLARVGS